MLYFTLLCGRFTRNLGDVTSIVILQCPFLPLVIGAVIFYAKACEWEVPNFSVETHLNKLWEIQQEIEKRGYYQGTETRFILVARKL